MSDRPSASELAALIVRCQSGLVPALSEEEFRRDYVDKLVARASFAMRREPGGELAGIIAYYADQPHGGFGFVTLVAVDPKQRGRGLARSMLNEVISACQACHLSEVRLTVNKDNSAAIFLYKACGFVLDAFKDEQIGMHLDLN